MDDPTPQEVLDQLYGFCGITGGILRRLDQDPCLAGIQHLRRTLGVVLVVFYSTGKLAQDFPELVFVDFQAVTSKGVTAIIFTRSENTFVEPPFYKDQTRLSSKLGQKIFEGDIRRMGVAAHS